MPARTLAPSPRLDGGASIRNVDFIVLREASTSCETQDQRLRPNHTNTFSVKKNEAADPIDIDFSVRGL
jgi:hypothetical protein